ncbi:MAG: WbqC family protein [Bacteroidales bacterium]|nr:WbqC family protein [Bacteroidales bacterium]
MPTIILPTAYLPPISWWALLYHEKEIHLELQETYPKQTYRNRCHIYSASGLLPLSIPVIRTHGNHTLVAEIGIDNKKNWQQIHWRSIESAYSRTPYFLYYKDYFSRLFHQHFDNLADFNLQLIQLCIKLLKLEGINIIPTLDFTMPERDTDYRLSIHPKKAPDKCGIHQYPRYIQAFEPKFGFIPNLSIIDLLFHLGPDAKGYLSKMIQLNLSEITSSLQDIQS